MESDSAAVKKCLVTTAYDLPTIIENMSTSDLQTLKAQINKYKSIAVTDTAIRSYSTFASDLAPIPELYILEPWKPYH